MARTRASALLTAAAVALLALATSGPATAGDAEPQGRLVYTMEYDGPPQCYDPPCREDDLEPGPQYDWIETSLADGSQRRALTPPGPAGQRHRFCHDGQPRFLGTPRISPDGRLIARGYCHKVLIEKLDGRLVQTLTVPGDAVGLDWGPGGRRLAVQTYASPGDTDRLYMVDRKSNRHRSIARDAGSAVRWSARYDVIAYWHVPNGHTVLVRPDGHVVGRIERDETDGFDITPTDRRIAYPCHRGACVMRFDGTHRHVLTGRCAHDSVLRSVAWAPDGRSLACVRAGGIAVVDLATDRYRIVRPLRHDETYEDAFDLDWGPAPQPGR